MNCPNCGSKMVWEHEYSPWLVCLCGHLDIKPEKYRELKKDWQERWKEANSEAKDE